MILCFQRHQTITCTDHKQQKQPFFTMDMLSECLKHNAYDSCQKYLGSGSACVGEPTSAELKIRYKLKLLQVLHRAMTEIWTSVNRLELCENKPSTTEHVVMYTTLAPQCNALGWVMRRHSLRPECWLPTSPSNSPRKRL